MTQEEKSLLLQDLCARLPYGVICKVKYIINNETTFGKDIEKECDGIVRKINFDNDAVYIESLGEESYIEDVKPYLRPISSMTDEEREEWTDLFNKQLLELEKYSDEDAEEIAPQMFAMSHFSSINWLYSKHFNIILPREAFIEVTKENNPYK